MANKKLIYNISDGKIKESSNNYFNDETSEIIINKLTSSATSLALSNGILLSNNKVLSSSIQQNNDVLQWDASNNKWTFKTATVSDGTVSIPINSDISGTLLNNITVRSIANAASGTLSVYNGGTGLSTADFPIDQECLLIADGSNKLKFLKKDEALKVGTRPYVLAPLTASSANDSSYNNNSITRVNGSYVTNAPSDSGWGFASGNGKAFQSSAGNVQQIVVTSPETTGDFTAECWVNLINYGLFNDVNFASCIFAINGSHIFELGVSTSYQLNLYDGGGNRINTSGPTVYISQNQWCHIALVRKNNNFYIYSNGVKSGPIQVHPSAINATYTTDYVGSTIWGASINGYIFEYSRVSYAKTDAEIGRYWNNITKSLESYRNKDYTPLSDNKLYKPILLAPFTSSAATTDISSNVNSITRVKGQIVSAPSSPFGVTNALSSSYDSSTGNYTATIPHVQYNGDFTTEAWINIANVGGSGDAKFRSCIFESNGGYGMGLSGDSFATSGFFSFWNGSIVYVSTISVLANNWYHVALTRKGSFFKFYINGTSSQEYAVSNNNNHTSLHIGTNTNALFNINGFMTEVSIVRYAKTQSEITAYYNAVLAGTQGRYTKDSTYIIEPSKTRSAAIVSNSQGNGWTAQPVDDDTYLDTSIFNYY